MSTPSVTPQAPSHSVLLVPFPAHVVCACARVCELRLLFTCAWSCGIGFFFFARGLVGMRGMRSCATRTCARSTSLLLARCAPVQSRLARGAAVKLSTKRVTCQTCQTCQTAVPVSAHAHISAFAEIGSGQKGQGLARLGICLVARYLARKRQRRVG